MITKPKTKGQTTSAQALQAPKVIQKKMKISLARKSQTSFDSLGAKGISKGVSHSTIQAAKGPLAFEPKRAKKVTNMECNSLKVTSKVKMSQH